MCYATTIVAVAMQAIPSPRPTKPINSFVFPFMLTSSRAMAIVLVEQILDVALELADHCFVMDRGKFVHEATARELTNNTEVLHSLFGLE